MSVVTFPEQHRSDKTVYDSAQRSYKETFTAEDSPSYHGPYQYASMSTILCVLSGLISKNLQCKF